MGPDANTLPTDESKYSSRKFILTAASLFVSMAALFTGFLSGEEFVDIIPMILLFYVGGNVASQYANKGK